MTDRIRIDMACNNRCAPLAIDLFCGLGGWTEGLLAEGYYVVGFDIERHQYGAHKYPAQLVLQDVLTLHGSQFKEAALIVASPPCQAYSYRAMPWSRAKALPPPDNSLFDACFRIQREACEAAGRHIPMVVENVRGAQKWVGRARWNFGSFYLWGDVPALMPQIIARKSKGLNWSDRSRPCDFTRHAGEQAIKNSGGSWFDVAHNTSSGCGNNPISGRKGVGAPRDPVTGKTAHGMVRWTNPDEGIKQGESGREWFTDALNERRKAATAEGVKVGKDWFDRDSSSPMRRNSSKSNARKAASALIAKIPLPLSRHIAAMYFPKRSVRLSAQIEALT